MGIGLVVSKLTRNTRLANSRRFPTEASKDSSTAYVRSSLNYLGLRLVSDPSQLHRWTRYSPPPPKGRYSVLRVSGSTACSVPRCPQGLLPMELRSLQLQRNIHSTYRAQKSIIRSLPGVKANARRRQNATP